MAKIFLGNIKGPKGDNGKNFAPKGVVNSVSELPAASESILGDAYYVGASAPRNIYACVYRSDGKTIAWVDQGALKGEDGDKLYIKFNSSPSDTNATSTWTKGQCYIGVLVSKEKTAPSTGYVWCKFIQETFTFNESTKTLTINI